MQSKTTVEIADMYSRKRAVIAAAAAIVFLVAQLIVRPFTDGWPGSSAHSWRSSIWAINAILLLAVLATGGGILNRREIKVLVNDEVARSNYRSAVIAGFWVAMTTALGLYFLPGFENFAANGAIFIIVSVSVATAMLTFSYLELRAHRDA